MPRRPRPRGLAAPHVLAMAWILAVAPGHLGCQGETPPPDAAPTPAADHPDLRQALAVVQELSSAGGTSVTTFIATGDDPTASAYVDFFFTPLGSRDWPPVAGGIEDPGDLSGWSRAIGMPLLPSSVRLVAWDPDPDAGRQLVVWADDGAGMLGASGFTAPDEAPVFEVRWPFRTR